MLNKLLLCRLFLNFYLNMNYKLGIKAKYVLFGFKQSFLKRRFLCTCIFPKSLTYIQWWYNVSFVIACTKYWKNHPKYFIFLLIWHNFNNLNFVFFFSFCNSDCIRCPYWVSYQHQKYNLCRRPLSLIFKIRIKYGNFRDERMTMKYMRTVIAWFGGCEQLMDV